MEECEYEARSNLFDYCAMNSVVIQNKCVALLINVSLSLDYSMIFLLLMSPLELIMKKKMIIENGKFEQLCLEIESVSECLQCF